VDIMSSPESSGRSRPLRVAGLALLGIAAGALLVGMITLGGQRGDGGNSGTGGAAPTTSALTPTAAPGTSEPVSTTTSPVPSPAPTTTEPAPPPAPPEPAAPIRVYNNSTIRGLAAQAADEFRRHGWVVEEPANYPYGRIPTSTVYFRPGTDEEAAAHRLGERFNLRVEPRFEGITGARPGLIVIVTNDYGSK
jgi:LytR cell envelope-related transcriptional attenuator